jgi:hypothetical protein
MHLNKCKQIAKGNPLCSWVTSRLSHHSFRKWVLPLVVLHVFHSDYFSPSIFCPPPLFSLLTLAICLLLFPPAYCLLEREPDPFYISQPSPVTTVMGNCASTSDRQAKAHSDAIDKEIEDDSKKFRKECKILLLGASACFIPGFVV